MYIVETNRACFRDIQLTKRKYLHPNATAFTHSLLLLLLLLFLPLLLLLPQKLRLLQLILLLVLLKLGILG